MHAPYQRMHDITPLSPDEGCSPMCLPASPLPIGPASDSTTKGMILYICMGCEKQVYRWYGGSFSCVAACMYNTLTYLGCVQWQISPPGMTTMPLAEAAVRACEHTSVDLRQAPSSRSPDKVAPFVQVGYARGGGGWMTPVAGRDALWCIYMCAGRGERTLGRRSGLRWHLLCH